MYRQGAPTVPRISTAIPSHAEETPVSGSRMTTNRTRSVVSSRLQTSTDCLNVSFLLHVLRTSYQGMGCLLPINVKCYLRVLAQYCTFGK